MRDESECESGQATAPRPADRRPEDQRPADHRPEDQRPADRQLADHQPTDHQPEDRPRGGRDVAMDACMAEAGRSSLPPMAAPSTEARPAPAAMTAANADLAPALALLEALAPLDLLAMPITPGAPAGQKLPDERRAGEPQPDEPQPDEPLSSGPLSAASGVAESGIAELRAAQPRDIESCDIEPRDLRSRTTEPQSLLQLPPTAANLSWAMVIDLAPRRHQAPPRAPYAGHRQHPAAPPAEIVSLFGAVLPTILPGDPHSADLAAANPASDDSLTAANFAPGNRITAARQDTGLPAFDSAGDLAGTGRAASSSRPRLPAARQFSTYPSSTCQANSYEDSMCQEDTQQPDFLQAGFPQVGAGQPDVRQIDGGTSGPAISRPAPAARRKWHRALTRLLTGGIDTTAEVGGLQTILADMQRELDTLNLAMDRLRRDDVAPIDEPVQPRWRDVQD